jgi:3-phenylpropionate/cinnamic acid dioxygenase small subunit
MDQVEQLVARAEIQDCLFRYARGVDRRDWSLVRECFYDDASDHHGEFRGTADEFISWVGARHAPIPFSMHFLGNCLIEFRDTTCANVETYFVAIQRREGADGNGAAYGTDFEVFGRYVDRFERRGDAWRVADRRVVYDSTRTQPSTSHLREVVGVIGRRDPSDPVFEM